jgi:hypothetical protein
MRIYETIIVGSGFSSFILSKILKKKHKIVSTNSKYINSLSKRKILTSHLKFFTKKYTSHGTYKYILKKSILHDTLIHGGNTNFWGGICNIAKISKYINFLKTIFQLKKINFIDTGSFSTNKRSFS